MIKTEGPLVSVIVPVYNVELYLEECLDSIIQQTLQDIEIICVNDGSTDTSPEILQRYSRVDDRIRIVNQENQGLSGARNTGARIATGKYLYFIDSDDVLNTEALELCVSEMEQRDLEFLCFNAVAFGEDRDSAKEAGERNSRYFKKVLEEEKVYTGEELFIELNTITRYTVPPWACLILRSRFLEYNLWFHVGIYYEDEPWMFVTLMNMSRCGCINRTLYHYRMRHGSIVHLTPSFAHAYGIFIASMDEQRFLLDNPKLLRSEQFKQIVTAHIARLQKISIAKYRACSEEEKQKRFLLSNDEYLRFQQDIAFPATVIDAMELKEEKKKASIEKKVETLEKDKATLEREKLRLTNKINSLKSSVSFRLGRILTFFPRKLKKKLRGIKEIQLAWKEKHEVAQTCANRIVVFPSEVTGNHIIFHYQVSGEWSSCFMAEETFEIIYPFDIERIPESIRIIPFLAQVLPVSWIWDAEIRVPACDRDFYDCLEKIKDGYKKMYPMYSFDGKLTVESVEENKNPGEGQKALVCFSGGVDATNTTISHLAEKPLLVSLWGADVPWDNTEGWQPLEAIIRKNSETLGLDQITVQTSFRKLLCEGVLNKCVPASGDNWYHGFQHGIGILGHVAPVTWHEGIGTVYIASSNTEGTVYTCASDPSIDNFVRFCGAKVIHDGYEMDRQDKIQIIADYSRKNGLQIPLHVCWEKRSGDNCCHCEKCWRTILGFYAAGEDPKQYGFPLFGGFDLLSDDLERDYHRFRVLTVANYQPLQKKLRERAAERDLPRELSWLVHADLSSIEEGSLRLHKGKLVSPVWLLGTPDYRNMGDQCIAEEEICFLREVMPDRCIVEFSEAELKKKGYAQLDQILPSQPVFLQGGGNLGTLWPNHEKYRRDILSKIKGNPVVIFPQSIWFSNDDEGQKALAEATEIYKGGNILLCCRDSVSYRFAQEHFKCRSILVPDMVLWESKQGMFSRERFGALTLLRSDKERKLKDDDQIEIELYLTARFRSVETFDTVLHSGKVTWKNRTEKIDDLIQRISSVECVVTDRLHGMILCAVSGTPCIVFGNGYHKVESFYEWLKPLGYIRFIHRTDELVDAIDEVCSCTKRIYPEKEMREQFGELVRSITGL